MIKFFRQVRQQLLFKNRFSKYIVYAIGEIILVVIGILIALQINNANEEQKLRALEKGYLIGILDDLKTDTTSINTVVLPNFREKHRPNHNYVDSLSQNNLFNDETLVSKASHPASLATSGLSFHPTVGTYNAIISNGNSGLISDQELFNSIQKLYEVWYKRNNEYSFRRDQMMDEIRFKYAYNFKYESKMEMYQNKRLLADLWYMYHIKGQYVGLLNDIEYEIVEIIKNIESKIIEK